MEGTAYTPDELLEILRPYKKDRVFYVAPDIPAEKLRNATAAMHFPDADQVLALLDATVMGSAKFTGQSIFVAVMKNITGWPVAYINRLKILFLGEPT